MKEIISTKHKFIDKYKIDRNSEKLILGTIHPNNYSEFKLDFFYGNKLTLWTILNSAFDNQLGNPITVESILLFLNNNKIAISDVIYECKRLNENALDKDLFDINYNPNLFNQIKSSNINEILFTSGFQKNNAFKLFYEGILNKKITREIKVNRGLTLENSIFGRSIKLTVLFSPSGSANVGISKSKEYLTNKEYYQKHQNPVKHFKIQYYKKQFGTIN